MKFLIRKINIIIIFYIIFLSNVELFAKDARIQYTRENIANYFSGIVSANQDNNNEAFKHLKKVQSLRKDHSKFNIEYTRTLILLDKFDKAFTFSKEAWNKDEYFFEADLLLGLESYLKKDYLEAEKYFERLNKISTYNVFFEDFIGNILVAWTKASKGNQKDSFKSLEKIPKIYSHIAKIQNSFLQCYFANQETEKYFKELINNKKYNFSRYNFFLASYLISNNKVDSAKKIINTSRKKHRSNLLLKQTQIFLLKGKTNKIKSLFSCQNPKHSMAEFFYILANLYASERDYQMSNFYMKISIFLNNKFLPNKSLLAENYLNQGKYDKSKKFFNSVKPIGSEYSWYASKVIAKILLEEKGKKYSVKSLEKEFNSLTDPNFMHYYELANFYKENQYFKESVKYYSLALKNLKKGHFLYSKILEKRGSSSERLGDWENGEKDLKESLKILPDQAHVLNYLAYTWIDKGINLEQGLEMLKKANRLKENDAYIIDSLGWAYYAKHDYIEAEELLQRAVMLLPMDPVVNDHYADALWMVNKNFKARYVWNYVLQLEGVEKKLKDIINKKLIYGIDKKL